MARLGNLLVNRNTLSLCACIHQFVSNNKIHLLSINQISPHHLPQISFSLLLVSGKRNSSVCIKSMCVLWDCLMVIYKINLLEQRTPGALYRYDAWLDYHDGGAMQTDTNRMVIQKPKNGPHTSIA